MSFALKISKTIDNHIWKITFSVDSNKIPESDKALMLKFGEPTISVGGVFGVDSFSLPDKFIRVRTDLPFTQLFDSKSSVFSTDTQLKAELFIDTFVDRYVEAFSALRALNDTFSGEAIVNI